jgi:hypothetical protein
MRLQIKFRIYLYRSGWKYDIWTSDFFRYAIEHLGISEYISKVTMETLPATLEKKALFGKDLGLGFDLGLTYYLKNIQFTASILDRFY